MIRFINVSLMRGTKPLLEDGRPHPQPRRQDRPDRRQWRRQIQPVRHAARRTARRTRARSISPPSGAWPTWRRRRRRWTAPRSTTPSTATSTCARLEAELARLEGEAADHGKRHRHRRNLQRPGRRRRLHGAVARRAAAAGPGLLAGPDAAAGGQLLGRLAHAPEPGAGADVPFRPAAAGRADQPPGPGRHHLAGRLAEALSRHPDHHLARPRLPRRDRATSSCTSTSAS